jgi:hypothetical protein
LASVEHGALEAIVAAEFLKTKSLVFREPNKVSENKEKYANLLQNVAFNQVVQSPLLAFICRNNCSIA